MGTFDFHPEDKSEILRRCLKASKFNVQKMADLLDVSRDTVFKWKKNERIVPDMYFVALTRLFPAVAENLHEYYWEQINNPTALRIENKPEKCIKRS